MYIRSLTILGLADLPHLSIDGLGRIVPIKGPSLAATAVGDGLALAFAALSEHTLRQLLCRWGLIRVPEEAEIEVEGIPVQATWKDRQLARGVVADHKQRRLSVRVDVLLDPLLCSELRDQSSAEPRLALSLGEPHSLVLEVSAFFGASWDVLSISIQSITISGERFPSSSAERAPWMNRLLSTLGERFVSHDERHQHAAHALSCLTTTRPDIHARYTLWSKLLAKDFGPVRAAQSQDGHAIFMAGDRPLSRFGVEASHQAQWAATAAMSGADIMWMGCDNPRAKQMVDGDASPLEQLWTVSHSGAIDPAKGKGPRTVLSMETE